MNPNSAHQRWSQWTFAIRATPRRLPGHDEVLDAARRFFRMLFRTTAGQVRIEIRGRIYTVQIQVEGPDAHDPQVREQVRTQFFSDFVHKGFGPGASLIEMEVRLLAGSAEDGRPRAQLLVLPPLSLTSVS